MDCYHHLNRRRAGRRNETVPLGAFALGHFVRRPLDALACNLVLHYLNPRNLVAWCAEHKQEPPPGRMWRAEDVTFTGLWLDGIRDDVWKRATKLAPASILKRMIENHAVDISAVDRRNAWVLREACPDEADRVLWSKPWYTVVCPMRAIRAAWKQSGVRHLCAALRESERLPDLSKERWARLDVESPAADYFFSAKDLAAMCRHPKAMVDIAVSHFSHEYGGGFLTALHARFPDWRPDMKDIIREHYMTRLVFELVTGRFWPSPFESLGQFADADDLDEWEDWVRNSLLWRQLP